MKVTALVILMLLLAPAAYADEKPRVPTTPRPSFDAYRAVIDRNIFSRRRVTPPPPGTNVIKPPEQTAEKPAATPMPAAPSDPASRHVLVGVSIVGGRATALVEDRDGQRTLRLQPGEQLLDRTITDITFDRVHLQQRGEMLVISPGQTLAGGDAPSAAPPPDTATPATTDNTPGASAAPPPADAAQAAILERLRQRRQQELNR